MGTSVWSLLIQKSSRRFSCSLGVSLLRFDVRLIVLSHEFHMFYEITTTYFKMVARWYRCRIIVIFPVISLKLNGSRIFQR